MLSASLLLVAALAAFLAGRSRSPRRTAAVAVSLSSIWKTPKPSCGMALPSFSVMLGTVLTSRENYRAVALVAGESEPTSGLRPLI